jgi:hypothetical protein
VSAGEVLEWRNAAGTWEIFTTTAGDFARVAAREDDDLLFMTSADGTTIYAYGRGLGGSTSRTMGWPSLSDRCPASRTSRPTT